MSSTDASLAAEPAQRHLMLPDWPAPAGVRGFVTLRHGGVSRGPWGRAGGDAGGWNLGGHCGDDPSDVARNRTLLRALLPAEPVWLDQVHGTEVFSGDSLEDRSDAREQGADAVLPRADAAVTGRRGVVLSVLTADCLPVLFTNASGTVAGIAHAGWRGLAGGVLERTLEALARLTDDRRWMAWLGPAIGPACFEVGGEVRDAFVARDGNAGAAFVPAAAAGKWLADLDALARLRLARAGVDSIRGGGHCTVSDRENFYSYRRDRITGRMASLIWLD